MEGGYRKVLYVVGANGAGLRRLSEATVHPAWSPDGSTIAFGREGDDVATILTIRPDGTGLQHVLKPGRFFSVYNLSWAPDGLEIRFQGGKRHYVESVGGTQAYRTKYGIHATSPDGSNQRLVAEVTKNHLAAWSPDDSSIAVFHRDIVQGSLPWHFARPESLSQQFPRTGPMGRCLLAWVSEVYSPRIRIGSRLIPISGRVVRASSCPNRTKIRGW